MKDLFTLEGKNIVLFDVDTVVSQEDVQNGNWIGHIWIEEEDE